MLAHGDFSNFVQVMSEELERKAICAFKAPNLANRTRLTFQQNRREIKGNWITSFGGFGRSLKDSAKCSSAAAENLRFEMA